MSATSLADEIVKACDNVEKTLAEAGASWRDVVNIHSYHVPTADDSIGDEHMSVMVDQFRKRFGESLPLWTALGVKALALPDQHVEIEVVAIVGSGSKQASVPGREASPRGTNASGRREISPDNAAPTTHFLGEYFMS